jgi:hypothetical protein
VLGREGGELGGELIFTDLDHTHHQHELRYLQYGVQLLEKGAIYDLEAGNGVWAEVNQYSLISEALGSRCLPF